MLKTLKHINAGQEGQDAQEKYYGTLKVAEEQEEMCFQSKT